MISAPKTSHRPTRSASSRPLAQSLENRRLLSVSIVQNIANQTFPQGSPAQQIGLNQVFVDAATDVQDLKFSAKSDNTSLIQTNVTAGVLTLSVAPNSSGFAHLNVTAAAPDGSTASETVRIQVTAAEARTLTVPIGPGHRSFSFVMANHTSATISLSGPGSGMITLGGDGLVNRGDHAKGSNQEIESIDLTGTTSATSLNIVGRISHKLYSDVGNITTDGGFGTVRVRKCNIFGDVTAAGGATNLIMDGAQSSTMTFGASAVPMNFTEGNFLDVNFSSPSAIRKVNGGQWASTDSVPETFSANYVNVLLAGSNFTPGVRLSGAGARGLTIGRLRVSGAIGENWDITGGSAPLLIGGTTQDWNATFGSLTRIVDKGQFSGRLNVPKLGSVVVKGNMPDAVLNLTAPNVRDLGSLSVKGVISNSAIFSMGTLGPISAEALQKSIVFAGVGTLAQGETLPTSASELAASATIQSIALHPRGKVVGFQASDVAANNIGSLSLTTTQVANNGVPFGVAATQIGFIAAHDLTNMRTFSFTKVQNPSALAAQIAAAKLNLQDFVIRVLS